MVKTSTWSAYTAHPANSEARILFCCLAFKSRRKTYLYGRHFIMSMHQENWCSCFMTDPSSKPCNWLSTVVARRYRFKPLRTMMEIQRQYRQTKRQCNCGTCYGSHYSISEWRYVSRKIRRDDILWRWWSLCWWHFAGLWGFSNPLDSGFQRTFMAQLHATGGSLGGD